MDLKNKLTLLLCFYLALTLSSCQRSSLKSSRQETIEKGKEPLQAVLQNKTRKRSLASVESAEDFLEEVEEEDEDLQVLESVEEGVEEEKDQNLQEVEELFQEENEDDLEIETPPEIQEMILEKSSPFQIKELPPHFEKGLPPQKEPSPSFPKVYFPHKIPQIRDGSLLSAAKRSTVETLRYLLGKGLNINFQDKRGNTALHYAVLGKRKENVKFLLKEGADLNLTNNKGLTPKALALKKKYNDLVSLFP